MAAKTPDTIIRESVGSLTLLACNFSSTNIDRTDTYASGLGTNVVGYWFNGTLASTSGYEVRVANSSGTFSFYNAEDDATGTLFILARI